MDVDTITDVIVGSSENVKDVHDVHIWSADGEYNILTTHVVLHQEIPVEKLHELKEIICQKLHTLGVAHTTMEFETQNETCDYDGGCES